MLAHTLRQLVPAVSTGALQGLRAATCSLQQRRGMLWSVEREKVRAAAMGHRPRIVSTLRLHAHGLECGWSPTSPAPPRPVQDHKYRPVDEIIDDKAITQALESTKKAATDPQVWARGPARALGFGICRFPRRTPITPPP